PLRLDHDRRRNPEESTTINYLTTRDTRRLGIDGAQHLGDYEILARLRHHGALTRLVDCTTDPFIALWFLCSNDESRDRDGVLLAIRRDEFKEIRSPWKPDSYAKMLNTGKSPAALRYKIPPIDPRIAAQRGLFLLHTNPLSQVESPESELFRLVPPSERWRRNSRQQLEKICGPSGRVNERGRTQIRFPAALGVVVPSLAKDRLLDELEKSFGFNATTIFPDFAGLGLHYSNKEARRS
ncbi:FRG domain-containing protein, partial [Gordonia humi]